jgi:hypothetical protein
MGGGLGARPLGAKEYHINIFIKILFTVLLSISLTSCSVFLGGLVALDNSANKGNKEIKYDEIIKLDKGKKIILELNDSTNISGIYKGYEEFNESEKEKKTITILNENNEVKSYSTSEVNKYYYIDEGGNIWTAAAIGGVVDAIIIYAILQGPNMTGSPILK